jgi:hypothetical protein
MAVRSLKAMSKKIVPTLGHSTFRFNEQFLDDRPWPATPGLSF